MPALNSFKFLRYLGVVGCVNLKSLFGGRATFTALGTLFIHRCPSLVSLPFGVRHLSALKILRINDCGTLDLLDSDDDNVPGLKSLKLLVIVKLPRLRTLPKWILQAAASAFNTLSCIVIEACPNFRGLPQEVLQKLDSYPKFKIQDCPKSIVPGDAHGDRKMKSTTESFGKGEIFHLLSLLTLQHGFNCLRFQNIRLK